METIIVATDGSARSNPNGPAGWAWYIDKQRWDYGSLPKASNQVAELYAIMKALNSIPFHMPILIKSDSLFWINTIGKDARTGWMQGWKKRGWVKGDGKIPANLALLKTLDGLLAKRRATTTLEWVKGHNGHEMNEMVDQLCTRASLAMLNGQAVAGGPGWSEQLSLNSTHSAVLNSFSGARIPPKKKAPVKRAPVKRSPLRVIDNSIVTTFDDDGPEMPARKQVRLAEQYCDACGGPISGATGECRCSD